MKTLDCKERIFATKEFVGLGHQHAANQKREGIWAELTFAKTSGTIIKDREKNRPFFAQWRHFTTTTRILFAFSFMFKFGNPSEV